MFEQFSATEKHTNRWAVVASFTGQAAVAGALVLLSIIQFQQLDLSALVLQPPPLFAPSPRPEPVRIVAVERSGSTPRITVSREWQPLVAPPRIPDKVHIIDDGPQVPVLTMSDLLSAGPARPTGSAHGAQSAVAAAPPPPAVVSQAPAAAKKPPSEPVRIGGDVLEAKIIRRVIPVYPALAKQIRLSGIVRLMGVIGEDGTVQNLQVLGGHPVLVPAAVEAVKQWLYRPTLLNGNPVAVAAPIEVHFILK
jgi:protein TonB